MVKGQTEQSTSRDCFHIPVFSVGARTRGVFVMGLNLTYTYMIKAIAQINSDPETMSGVPGCW